MLQIMSGNNRCLSRQQRGKGDLQPVMPMCCTNLMSSGINFETLLQKSVLFAESKPQQLSLSDVQQRNWKLIRFLPSKRSPTCMLFARLYVNNRSGRGDFGVVCLAIMNLEIKELFSTDIRKVGEGRPP